MPPSEHSEPPVTIETAAIRLAGRQHGVVTRRQLLAAGIATHVIEHRVTAGRLRAVHRGVYLVGPVMPPHAAEMAACLAAGPGAVIGHKSAAALWGLLGQRARPAAVEVLVVGRHPERPGIRARRVRSLRAEEVTRLDGIPVTTAARTLLDLSSAVKPRTLERALAEALARRLATADTVRTLVGRHRGRPGAARLGALLEEGRPAFVRSGAEERLLALVRRARLPPPELNVVVAGHEVDFFWPEDRLVVEVDGFASHSSRRAFERDRRRDAELVAAGLRVVRVTWRQLEEEPEAVLVRIARALESGPTPVR